VAARGWFHVAHIIKEQGEDRKEKGSGECRVIDDLLGPMLLENLS
jgi:hypothetical protein